MSPGERPDPRRLTLGGPNGGTQQKRQTFGDEEHHRQERYQHSGDGYRNPSSATEGSTGGTPRRRPPPPRWSFVLQDIPHKALQYLNDVNTGYAWRLGAVAAVSITLGSVFYYAVFVPRQERKPLAQRSWLAPAVPITLLDKRREADTNMFVYTFALPNSYDYTGYQPVSSVQLCSGAIRGLSSLRRWYTPISHPSQRGIVEFAVKDCDPGRMSARLRGLSRGDIIYMGRWMREFNLHRVRAGEELGLVCTTSGSSIALQIMNILDRDPSLDWRLRVLYCHHTAKNMPFKNAYFDAYASKHPGRISVSYDVLSMGDQTETDGFRIGENTFVGNLDPSILEVTLPPPVAVRHRRDEGEMSKPMVGLTGPSAASEDTYRPYVLVCGPQSMLRYVCGRVSPISNRTYWQGLPYRYGGMLKDAGYERAQVYKFGVSTHFLAIR